MALVKGVFMFGKIRVFYAAIVLVFACSYSFAQDLFADSGAVFTPQVVPEFAPISLDSIPQGFSSQIKAAQPAPVAEPPKPKIEPPSSSSSVKVSSSSVAYKSYEIYLDSLVAFARNIQPGKEKLEIQKALINESQPKPKSEYEKQADYDNRIANFDKEKQKKIRALEKEYQAEEKSRIEKLKDAIYYKPDIQPEWNALLKQDTTMDEYNERIEILSNKLSYMKNKTTQVKSILSVLDVLSDSDIDAVDKKNRIYLARLERARELMRDYILQEQAKVLSTERKKFNMAFGAYNPEKEEFQINMNDIYSQTVPFDYVGFIKVSPAEAQVIDRKTDDFLASIDYINFPFVVNGQKLYPGTKKAEIYYKDKAVKNIGIFRNVPGFENLNGYTEWAVKADSLISGKLVAKKLDSSYAMKSVLPKAQSEGTWWSRNKNFVRVTFFVLAAAGAGVGVWQNIEANKVSKDVKELGHKAYDAGANDDKINYYSFSERYEAGKKNVHKHENLRNGFYIGAGVFGAAGILSLAF